MSSIYTYFAVDSACWGSSPSNKLSIVAAPIIGKRVSESQ